MVCRFIYGTRDQASHCAGEHGGEPGGNRLTFLRFRIGDRPEGDDVDPVRWSTVTPLSRVVNQVMRQLSADGAARVAHDLKVNDMLTEIAAETEQYVRTAVCGRLWKSYP
jgi:hypothetical protein